MNKHTITWTHTPQETTQADKGAIRTFSFVALWETISKTQCSHMSSCSSSQVDRQRVHRMQEAVSLVSLLVLGSAGTIQGSVHVVPHAPTHSQEDFDLSRVSDSHMGWGFFSRITQNRFPPNLAAGWDTGPRKNPIQFQCRSSYLLICHKKIVIFFWVTE